MELHRPRQWGACWLACQLYEQLGLDRFWAERLPLHAKVRAGSTSCRRWCVIGLSIRAASGACTGNGSSRARWRICSAEILAGGKRCALPLPGQAVATQRGAVLASAPALAGFVRGAVRCVAVRLDEHLFQVCAAGRRSRQAPPRLQPRQAQRLCGGGDCADRDARCFRSATRCWRGTPPTRPHCAACCAR